jgi:hypothetical protein
LRALERALEDQAILETTEIQATMELAVVRVLQAMLEQTEMLVLLELEQTQAVLETQE